MKAMGYVVLICCVLIMSSCVTLPSADFTEGYNRGQDVAALDADSINCAKGRSYLSGPARATGYDGQLREEGRSPKYIDGFKQGYRRAYNDRLSSYCGN
jgi:hypothetical protein